MGALDVALRSVFLAYLITVGAYLALQTVFAERARRAHVDGREPSRFPSVDVIVPCHNEDPAVLAACLDSITRQDYAGPVRLHVVDDGSPNIAELDAVYRDFGGRPGTRVILLPANRGKRHAQAEAIVDSGGEIVISVDSDTVIAPDGIRRLVAGLDDPRVGAVMGEMRAGNARVNLLTRIIDLRYWYACNQERAAQSLFGAVLCCSGPFSAYRRSVIERALPEYLNQTFRRRPSTHGEDRHLTNLVLSDGMRTSYVPDARAATIVPERMRPFLRQQLRWNRCIYRDMLTIASRLPALGPYLVLDAFVQIFGPALLALSVTLLLLRAVLLGAAGLAWFGAGLLLIALMYCAYGLLRTRNPRFAGFALYGLLHVFVLIPLRLWALLTLTDDRWGQRGAGVRPARPRSESPDDGHERPV